MSLDPVIIRLGMHYGMAERCWSSNSSPTIHLPLSHTSHSLPVKWDTQAQGTGPDSMGLSRNPYITTKHHKDAHHRLA
jgi:hypothetical protein